MPKKGPEPIRELADATDMARARLAKAEEVAAKEQTMRTMTDRGLVILDKKNPPKEDTLLAFNLSLNDAQGTLHRRIEQHKAMLAADKHAWDKGDRNMFNTLRGSMIAAKNEQYIPPAEEVRVLAELEKIEQELKSFSVQTHSMDALKQMRVRLGMPELPQNLVARYDTFAQLAVDATIQKDPSLSVDWEELRQEFEETMVMLDRAEIAIEIGGAVAISVVTGGSGPAAVLAAQLALTIAAESEKVIMTNKPVGDAVQDAVISAICNALGMKIGQSIGQGLKTGVKTAGIDPLLAKAGELMGQVVKNKAVVEGTKKTAASFGQNSIEGAADTVLSVGAHSITDTVREEGFNSMLKAETYSQALADVGQGIVPGTLSGGVMGTLMQGIMGKIRKPRMTLNKPSSGTSADTPPPSVIETLQARMRQPANANDGIRKNGFPNKNDANDKEIILNTLGLSDTSPDEIEERLARAVTLLGDLTPDQEKNLPEILKGMWKSHSIKPDGYDAEGMPIFSPEKWRQKIQPLDECGVTKDQKDRLFRWGALGPPPPPPVPRPKIAVTPQSTVGPKPPPPPPVPKPRVLPTAQPLNTVLPKGPPPPPPPRPKVVHFPSETNSSLNDKNPVLDTFRKNAKWNQLADVKKRELEDAIRAHHYDDMNTGDDADFIIDHFLHKQQYELKYAGIDKKYDAAAAKVLSPSSSEFSEAERKILKPDGMTNEDLVEYMRFYNQKEGPEWVTLFHATTDVESITKGLNRTKLTSEGLGATKGEVKGTFFLTPDYTVAKGYLETYRNDGKGEKAGIVAVRVRRNDPNGSVEGEELRLKNAMTQDMFNQLKNEEKKTSKVNILWIKPLLSFE